MASTDELLERARRAGVSQEAARIWIELDRRLSGGDPVPVPWLLARKMRQWQPGWDADG